MQYLAQQVGFNRYFIADDDLTGVTMPIRSATGK